MTGLPAEWCCSRLLPSRVVKSYFFTRKDGACCKYAEFWNRAVHPDRDNGCIRMAAMVDVSPDITENDVKSHPVPLFCSSSVLTFRAPTYHMIVIYASTGHYDRKLLVTHSTDEQDSIQRIVRLKFKATMCWFEMIESKIRIQGIRHVLGSGMNLHLTENDLVRDIFELGERISPVNFAAHKQSKLERHLMNAAAFKARTISRSKNRDKRSAVMTC
uniref:Interferon-related developmental regulator C-terminal domain-containing protein n=1 Tax=Timema genevievae TaxID=629358 RepID=A0A7R9PPY8_TIMGE|nr:unnamed protein product [Timema genevievae]